jgi:hypothetical protein
VGSSLNVEIKTIMSIEDSILKSVVAATPKLVQLLTPLTPEGRQRAIASAMMVFGETPSFKKTKEDDNDATTAGEGICPKAAVWMKKNVITREQLEHVFSIDKDAIDIIAAKMPGKGKAKQTVEVYVLCGVAIFLKTGEMSFTDECARKLCEKVGACDKTNHAANIKKFGNLITGSKDSGWKITNPGLLAGSKIIKQLIPEASA